MHNTFDSKVLDKAEDNLVTQKTRIHCPFLHR